MANEYATLDELKALRRIDLSDTTDDAILQARLTRASRAIDDRCGRRFYADDTASERIFPVGGRLVQRRYGESLIVDDISSLTDLAVSSHNGETTVSLSDLRFEPDNALARGLPIQNLLRHNAWWGFGDVHVTARWGWPSVPDAVAEACLLLANRRYFRKDSPEGVAGQGTEGPIRLSRFDPDVEDLIESYVIAGFGA